MVETGCALNRSMRFARLLVVGLPLSAGFSVRPLVSKRPPHHPAPLSMSEQQQDAPKTYPPPHAVPDGMKTYEVTNVPKLQQRLDCCVQELLVTYRYIVTCLRCTFSKRADCCCSVRR